MFTDKLFVIIKKFSLSNEKNSFFTLLNEILDDTQRLSIGHCLHSMNNHNQEKLKNFSNMVIPLVFFAMHVEKVPGS